MSWIRKLAFLAIIWAVAIAALLVGTELFLRLTDGGWGSTLRLNLVRSSTYDYPVSSLYAWKSPTIRYVRDKYGLRDDCASPADIDILTIGGSTTDQRFLAQESTYQAVMQKDLTQATGHDICVSNAGIDGHSTYGHLRAFRDWLPLIPRLHPKLFIFYIGINDADFTRAGPADFEAKAGAGYGSPLRRFQVVQLGLWVRDTLNSAFGRRPAHAGRSRVEWRTVDYPQERLATDTPERAARNAAAFRQRLRQMLRFARAWGADVLCVTQPHRMARSVDGRERGIKLAFGGDAGHPAYGGLDYDYSLRQLNRVMREECGERRLVDLYSTNFEDDDFYDYVHTTPSGARKVGSRIAGFIEQSDLIDELRTGSAR